MFPTKRKREDFEEEVVEKLECAWQDGMKSAGKKCNSMIEQLSSQLNISTERIASWIGNRQAKERRAAGGASLPKKQKNNFQGPNAYSYFARSIARGSLDKESYFKHVAEKWKQLPANQKHKFKAEAQSIRGNPLLERSRKEVISLQLRKISEACEVLDSYGYIIGGLGKDTKEEYSSASFGCPSALDFFDFKLQESFSVFVSGAAPMTTTINPEKEQRKKLRQLVRKHFHSAWVQATGSKKAIPYHSIHEKKIVVNIHGMPTGLEFKEPSSYGIASLKKILKAPLRFDVRSTDSSIRVSTQGSLDQNLDTGPEPETSPVRNAVPLKKAAITTSDENVESDLSPAAVIDGLTMQSLSLELLSKTKAQRVKKSTTSVSRTKKQATRRKKAVKDKKNWKVEDYDANEVYQAVEILEEKMVKGNKVFLVKWDGYPKPTWEPQINIIDEGLLQAFYAKKK